MFIVPVPFSVDGAKTLQHAKWLMEETDEDGSSLIAIHPSFDKLFTSLRTAVANESNLIRQRRLSMTYLMHSDYPFSFTRGVKHRVMDDHFVVLNPNSSSSTNKYFCSHCNTRLIPLAQEDKIGGYLCIKCTIVQPQPYCL
jgi:hypothetical protein